MSGSAMLDDTTLRQRLLDGDLDAQELLVRRYLASLTRFVEQRYSLLSNDAEDIALDAIYEAMIAIGRFDPQKSSLASWIKQRARWRATTEIHRRLKHVTAPLLPAARRPPLQDAELTSEDARRRLLRLRTVELQLLQEYLVNGRSTRQLARDAGVSHRTIQVRIASTLEKLRPGS
jgi:RNA polymerase sigma factor (sigma-70 family)